MNILEYAKLKKTLGGTSGGATAYHVSSVDELPADAVDGSLAVVENSDSIVGVWKFNDELDFSMLEEELSDDGEYVGVIKFISNMIGYKLEFEEMPFYEDEPVAFSYYNQTLSTYNEDVYASGGWKSSAEKEIEILEDPDDNVISTFIKTNCNRLSGGHTLYSRENGKWVSKGEI